MRKLLFKLFLLLLILIVIKLPFALVYKDELFYHKNQLLSQEYNTIFVGSSRTRDGISPGYFDSLTKYKTKSYNYGITAGLPPETFIWTEDLIENNKSLEYIIFELSGDQGIPYINEEPWVNFRQKDYLVVP